MPVYAYRCQSCGLKFKMQQSYADKQLTRCPDCHMSTVWRVPQLPAIIFKGPGWYSTDHRLSSGPTSKRSKKHDQVDSATGEKAGA